MLWTVAVRRRPIFLPGWNLHTAQEIEIDDFQAKRSPDNRYRTDMRILVERMVEDTLLNKVVCRFLRAVHTQKKIASLAKIKPEDCQLIDEFMTKYSRYEHSQPSRGTRRFTPDPISANSVKNSAMNV